jgi:hypothetical protein
MGTKISLAVGTDRVRRIAEGAEIGAALPDPQPTAESLN